MQAIVIAHKNSLPLRRIAGLTLLERNLALLRAAGADRIVVADAGVDGSALSCQGVTVADLHNGLASLDPKDTDVVVLSATRIHDPAVAKWLKNGEPRADSALTWKRSSSTQPIPVYRLPLSMLTGALLGTCGDMADLEEFADELREAGCAVEIGSVDGPVVDIQVHDDDAARQGEEALWKSCRKPIDGVVSRHLNRYISLAISRRLVNTRVTPNQVSVLCLILGSSSFFFAMHATWLSMVTAASLLKINSILDGVDGELARMKWAQSVLGEFLDSIGDNVANFSFFGGFVIALFRMDMPRWGTLGVVSLAMWATHLLFVYARLRRMKRGDVLLVRNRLDASPDGWRKEAIRTLRYDLLRRDSLVMLTLLLMLGGLYRTMGLVLLTGSSIVFGVVLLELPSCIAGLRLRQCSAAPGAEGSR